MQDYPSLVPGKWHAIRGKDRWVRVLGGCPRYIQPRCTTISGDAWEHYTFVRPSMSRDRSKLMVLLMGGGGCWSTDTCLYNKGQPYLSERLWYSGDLYKEMILDPNNVVPTIRTGILGNDASPYRDYNMIYVQYCTADAHLGQRQVEMAHPDQTLLMNFSGFDNFQSALDIAAHYFPPRSIKRIVFGGLSSGGLGVYILHPYVLNLYKKAARKNSLVLIDHSAPHILPTPQHMNNLLELVGGRESIPKWIQRGLPGSPSILELFYKSARYYRKTVYAITHPQFDEYLSAVFALAMHPEVTAYPASSPIRAVLTWITDGFQCTWARETHRMHFNMRTQLDNVRIFEHFGDVHVLAYNERVFTTRSGPVDAEEEGKDKKEQQQEENLKKEVEERQESDHMMAIDWLTSLHSPTSPRRRPIETPSLICADPITGSLDGCLFKGMKVNQVREALFRQPLRTCNPYTSSPSLFLPEEDGWIGWTPTQEERESWMEGWVGHDTLTQVEVLSLEEQGVRLFDDPSASK